MPCSILNIVRCLTFAGCLSVTGTVFAQKSPLQYAPVVELPDEADAAKAPVDFFPPTPDDEIDVAPLPPESRRGSVVVTPVLPRPYDDSVVRRRGSSAHELIVRRARIRARQRTARMELRNWAGVSLMRPGADHASPLAPSPSFYGPWHWDYYGGPTVSTPYATPVWLHPGF